MVAVSLLCWGPLPIACLWVGSQVPEQKVLSIKAVAAVVIVLAVLVFALAVALTWLNNTYGELIGRPRVERRAPWLRSMRAESEGTSAWRGSNSARAHRYRDGLRGCHRADRLAYLLRPGRIGDSEPRPAAQLGVRHARLVQVAAVSFTRAAAGAATTWADRLRARPWSAR